MTTSVTSTCHETGLTFTCQGDTLVGVLALPIGRSARNGVGVLIVVGGPQYRAGSHRQFTLLARALAGGGWPTLRFDVRGMGDSEGDPRGFEDQSDDIRAAIDALQAADASIERVVLWGLCDGASAALLYLGQHDDQRVGGLCLVNPWVRSEETLARTHVKHYYAQRLLDPAFWRKLAVGGVGLAAVRGFGCSVARALSPAASRADGNAEADFRVRMLAAWSRFEGPTLLALSGDDFVAREFVHFVSGHPAWMRTVGKPLCHRVDVENADHTFSTPLAEGRLLAAVLEWLCPLGGTADKRDQECTGRGT